MSLEYTDSSYEEKRYTMGDGNATFLVRHLLPYHLGSILVPVGAWGSNVDAKCLSQSLCTLFLRQGFLVNLELKEQLASVVSKTQEALLSSQSTIFIRPGCHTGCVCVWGGCYRVLRVHIEAFMLCSKHFYSTSPNFILGAFGINTG